MERVRVVKEIPGILNVGDILISTEVNDDFCLEETTITKAGSNERYISLDYLTVCDNAPEYFMFEWEDNNERIPVEEKTDCECEKCTCTDDIPFGVRRTNEAIIDRYDFFRKGFNQAPYGSESSVVYQNLIWFIDWLFGKTELKSNG